MIEFLFSALGLLFFGTISLLGWVLSWMWDNAGAILLFIAACWLLHRVNVLEIEVRALRDKVSFLDAKDRIRDQAH